MIPGGYYLKARKAKTSWIARTSPCIREIWDWLISEANHEDNGVCKRGQLVRSYADIQEGLAWFVGYRKMTYSKWDCERALKALTKECMVATSKTTRGLLITICNYDTYQNPANYERHTEDHNDATRTPQTPDRVNKNDKNEKNVNDTPLPPKGRVLTDEPSTLEEKNFELARVLWPGKKRGFRTEFENFKKHHTDWRELLDDDGLAFCVQTLIDRKSYSPGFWPHFQTFTNQSRYEEAMQPPEVKR